MKRKGQKVGRRERGTRGGRKETGREKVCKKTDRKRRKQTWKGGGQRGVSLPTHVSPYPCWRGGFVYSLVHPSYSCLGTGMREETGHHGERQTSWLRQLGYGAASTGA